MALPRLVQHDRLGDTPMGLLARLRAIDPAVELVHALDDLWWLGAVTTEGPGFAIRREQGERMLAIESRRAQPNPRNVLLARLQRQGFALIAAYRCAGDPEVGPVRDPEGYECSIVQDFAERDHAWRKDQGETAVRRRFGVADARNADHTHTLLDKLYTDGRDAFLRSQRGRVVVGQR
jgi:hypothetical protein